MITTTTNNNYFYYYYYYYYLPTLAAGSTCVVTASFVFKSSSFIAAYHITVLLQILSFSSVCVCAFLGWWSCDAHTHIHTHTHTYISMHTYAPYIHNTHI